MMKIKLYFISFVYGLVFNAIASQHHQTVKPDYAEKIQHLLENQKQLDCQQFDADLIECFAYNLFLKNAALFQDLDNESVLVKPILTKHFENKTVNKGDNVTLTCETQIDALPIFLFYKLNRTILSEYIKNKNSNLLLSQYSFALQERSESEMNDYKSIDPGHIRIERRIHSIDSNKDNLADLETINLRIFNAVQSDSGYYLCIVANSIKSFRVTYSFLNVVVPQEVTTTVGLYDNIESDLLSESTKFSWSLRHNYILIGFLVAIILFILMVSTFICYCCLHLSQTKFNNPDLVITNIRKDLAQSNNELNHIITAVNNETNNNVSKMNLIEKTMNSMKNNFDYVPMPSGNNDQLDSHKVNIKTFIVNEILENDELEFSREKLKLGRLIDEGAFGRVYLADAYGIIAGRYKTTVAVKMLKENASKIEYENFIKEMEIMRSAGKHENIISLLGCCTTKSGPVYALVEYAKLGNLRNYLRAHRPKDYILYSGADEDSYQSQNEEEFSIDENEDDLEDKTAFRSIIKLQKQLKSFKTNNNLYSSKLNTIQSPCLSFTSASNNKLAVSTSFSQTNLMIDLIRFSTQISNGMKYLHSRNICHRDLAARNILLNEFKIAKIADFGLARDLQQNYYYKKKSESPMPVRWMAPEILFDGRAYQNSDQWSFGILMWEIFTLGGNPYPSVPVETLFDYLKEGNRMSKPMYCDDELYEIILDCWNFKADLRPSFANINARLNHILDKYERKKIEQITANNTPIKSLKQHETPTRLNLIGNKLNSPSNKKIMSSRQSESEDSQYFSGTDTSLVYADSHSSSNSSCNFSTMSPVSCFSNTYSVLPSNNAAAVRAATLMAVSLAQGPPSPPPLKPLSRLLNVASAAYDL